MSSELKSSRAFARKAIRELLNHKGKATVSYYVNKVNLSVSEREISRILADVRQEI